LQELYGKYNADGLEILGFPCNQFGGQEPGTPEEIRKFVTDNFGVTFTLTEKVDVNGDKEDPLWTLLKSKKGGLMGSFIKWNFTKFVVDKEGVVTNRYAPKDNPLSFESHLCELLGVPVKPAAAKAEDAKEGSAADGEKSSNM